ncbi:MAG: type II toxin-antitoxin system RelE/ParE family toxin [Thermodesulfobacteriota bacterium]
MKRFPEEVRGVMGYALHVAQNGGKADSAKPLKGIVAGSGILEVADDFDGNTYRAVYTVKFQGVVYVLHSFQKKSKRGTKTPQLDIKLIKARYKQAEEDHVERTKK